MELRERGRESRRCPSSGAWTLARVNEQQQQQREGRSPPVSCVWRHFFGEATSFELKNARCFSPTIQCSGHKLRDLGQVSVLLVILAESMLCSHEATEVVLDLTDDEEASRGRTGRLAEISWATWAGSLREATDGDDEDDGFEMVARNSEGSQARRDNNSGGSMSDEKQRRLAVVGARAVVAIRQGICSTPP